MVTSINRQEVSPEEQLSNQVYLFSRKEGTLKIVSNAPAGGRVRTFPEHFRSALSAL